MSSYKRTEFGDRILECCRRFRARGEGRDGLAHPIYAHWLDGIHPRFRALAERAVAEDRVRLHDYVAAVSSSMAFGLNLFLPFREAPGLLEPLLLERLGRVVTVTGVQFEYGGPGGVLAEIAGDNPTSEEHFTASDVALWLQGPDGRRGVALVEVKLSEGGFTPCGGADSRGNRQRHVCASAEVFLADPDACYLIRTRHARRDRRYWKIFEEAYGTLDEAFPGIDPRGPCPFRGDAQQPMRNHALALGLEQAGVVDFAWFGLCQHDENPDVSQHWEQYLGLVKEPEWLFTLRASEVVAAGAGEWPDWGRYMGERYGVGVVGD